VVRATEHVCNPPQLSHTGHVQAVLGRRAVSHRSVPGPRWIRPSHLRLLHRRDVHQTAGDGTRREEVLPGRHVEPTRYVHRPGRVNDCE